LVDPLQLCSTCASVIALVVYQRVTDSNALPHWLRHAPPSWPAVGQGDAETTPYVPLPSMAGHDCWIELRVATEPVYSSQKAIAPPVPASESPPMNTLQLPATEDGTALQPAEPPLEPEELPLLPLGPGSPPPPLPEPPEQAETIAAKRTATR
jgi:hypothetical protein